MDRYRLIASIVVLFIYLLFMYPWQTILVAVILLTVYTVLSGSGPSSMIERNAREDRRRTALKTASMYLAPYNDIWRNLRLANRFCSIKLGSHSHSITASDARNSERYFIVADSNVHSYEDLWNMFCLNFDYNTTFDELVQLAERLGATIRLNEYQILSGSSQINNVQNNTVSRADTGVTPEQKIEKKELLDVNNASEIELTALPGISIVMAKKLIKRREEIGGFKTVNDVFLFLHIKPHIQSQLEKLICVNKMKSAGKTKRYNERSIDL